MAAIVITDNDMRRLKQCIPLFADIAKDARGRAIGDRHRADTSDLLAEMCDELSNALAAALRTPPADSRKNGKPAVRLSLVQESRTTRARRPRTPA